VRRKYGPFTPHQEEPWKPSPAVSSIRWRMAITELRQQAGNPKAEHVVAAIRKAFHLND